MDATDPWGKSGRDNLLICLRRNIEYALSQTGVIAYRSARSAPSGGGPLSGLGCLRSLFREQVLCRAWERSVCTDPSRDDCCRIAQIKPVAKNLGSPCDGLYSRLRIIRSPATNFL